MERKICIYFLYNFASIGCYQTTPRLNGEHNFLGGYLISPYPYQAKLSHQFRLPRISGYLLINILPMMYISLKQPLVA